MATIKYRIQFTGSGGAGVTPVAGVISAYLAGASGTPQTRAYPIAGPPPAFGAYPYTIGYGGPVIADGSYYVDYKDASAPNQRLAKVNLVAYAGSCWTDGAYVNPTYELIRFDTYVMVRAHTSAPAPAQASLDGGLTWKNLVFAGVGTEAIWTNAEIALMGHTDTIPEIKVRRNIISDVLNITSFADPADIAWPPSNFTRANMPDTTGLIVGQIVTFYNSTMYFSGQIVEIGAGSYIVFQSGFIGSQTGVYIATATPCVATIAEDFFIGSPSFAPLVVTETHTNETSAPANDGTINLIPSGGSGSRSYLWGDGSTAQNRTGLPANIYTVTITDDITLEEVDLSITITEPVPEPIPVGSYHDIPKMQSLRFVREEIADDCTIFQNFDNTLFCKMNWYAAYKAPFSQKVCKCDVFPIQIWSNYPAQTMELFSYAGGSAIKTFDVVLKQQLTGLTSIFDVFLTDSGVDDLAGTTRVFFNSGTIPLPLNPGVVFNLTNNAEGMNGTYTVLEIKNDILVGSPYLLITLVYAGAGPSSSGKAAFIDNIVDFDIYESIIDLTDVAEGEYFLKQKGINLDATYIEVVSEPIDLKVKHPKTNLLEFRCADNAFGVVYTTGITHKVRIESHLMDTDPGGADENYRESNDSPVKLVGKPRRRFKFKAYSQPFYRLELLRIAFSCDFTYINRVRYESDENTGSPTARPRYPLNNVEVLVEQVGWFADYNGDDLGTVESDGFVTSQLGFIRRT